MASQTNVARFRAANLPFNRRGAPCSADEWRAQMGVIFCYRVLSPIRRKLLPDKSAQAIAKVYHLLYNATLEWWCSAAGVGSALMSDPDPLTARLLLGFETPVSFGGEVLDLAAVGLDAGFGIV